MMDRMRDKVCIVIRTCRKPPILTLESFALPSKYAVLLIADPRVYPLHKKYYNAGQIKTVLGEHGLSPQTAATYRIAHRDNFSWMFRLDDDLTPGFFIHKDGRRLEIEHAMRLAWRARKELDVSLVGFAKTANRFWMKEGWGRVFGLIHGAAVLAATTNYPESAGFTKANLPLYDDVYESCGHRAAKNAVGRVREVGLDLATNMGTTATHGLDDPHQHERARRMILKRYSDFVTCDGEIFTNKGRLNLPWRFKRHATYTARVLR